jgi:glycosyltransferase involved in cell wall biosynthesis
LKVVVAHNRYQSTAPSGENRVVEAEIELLRAAGVEVLPFMEDSDELIGAPATAMANAALGPVLSPRGLRRFHRILRGHRPDVVHLHNVFPLISPWVVRTAAAVGIPLVQTVHNYRQTCIAGTHLRDGRLCEDCMAHALPWPAVQHACYRASRPQSAMMALGQVVHRPTWRLVSRFLAASPHMQSRLESIGVRPDRIEWRPNYAEDHGVTPMPELGGVVFVGRLDELKGVDLLLRAWTPEVAKRWGRLVIVGNGPLDDLVGRRAQQDPTVEWRGALDSAGVRKAMQEARLVALPSLCLEGFPLVAAEAMSIGRPLLLWEGAGVSRLADFGAAWALDAGPKSWSRWLLNADDAAFDGASVAARRFYDMHCAPGVSLQQLTRVYEAVMQSPAGP